MKKLFILLAFFILIFDATAQNTFPPTGNAGIGTNAPNAKLGFNDLNDGTNLPDGITWFNPAPLQYGIYRTSGSWTAPDYQQLKLSWNTGIILDPGTAYGKSYVDVQGSGIRVPIGNVGIGTTTPAAKLNIVYAGNTDPSNQAIQIESTNPANYGSINLKNSSGDLGLLGLSGSSFSFAGMFRPQQTFLSSGSINGIALIAYDINAPITFGTGGSATTNERMRIDKLGNVGIGISNPSQILHIHQGGYAGMRTTTNLTGSTINDGVNFGYDDSYGAYIWNRENSPIIFSANNTEKVRVTENGNVGIGTPTPDAKLTVKGNIHTNEVKVDLLGAIAPDYVFEKDYDLMSLEETKAYIDANKHLPEVPSAKEMEKNGVQLGEMNMLLLKKVEELTLYMIKVDAKNAEYEMRIKALEKIISSKK